MAAKNGCCNIEPAAYFTLGKTVYKLGEIVSEVSAFSVTF
jgi:hypothetical protein